MGLHSDNVTDVASASNFKDLKTTHLHFDLNVSFDEKQISGVVELSLTVIKDGLKTVTLDSHQTLCVNKVSEKGVAPSLTFHVKPFANYGTSLIIDLPEAKKGGENFVLEVDYVATEGPGVCWLDPPQTADKKKPFLYTQGQSALNRSFFPCQDTPAVKATYSAFVKVPSDLTAIMSANINSFGEKANRNGDKECGFFEQTVPIQSYLVALAVGDIKAAEIGPRSKVWAEPSMVDKAKAEFEGVVEEFISTGEQLFGEYVWGCYDILIMPPSFPYGGMENPCLTFVTPCIVVGDKSLTDVVIHEITHSWFGNLVTNANWSEFWLNEGFTMFGQRRIEEKIFGKAEMCLEAATGQQLLRKHMEEEGNDGPLTKLRVVIEEGVDPDDTYNETPYEKGFIFLCYLRSLVGGDDEFDKFLKKYVENFKFKSIVAEDFFDFFLNYFPKLKEENVHEKEGFEFVKTWLNTPGWPPYTPDLSSHCQLTEPADQAADVFSTASAQGDVPDIRHWGTYQIIYFLDLLVERSPLPPEGMQRFLRQCDHIAKSHNAEIKLRWCEMVIKNDIKDHYEDIRQFLLSQGKQKYTKPLYQAMVKGSEDMRKFAKQVFDDTQKFLHSSVRNYVKDILKKGKCMD